MEKQELDKFLELYNEYKPLYDKLSIKLHEMICKIKPFAENVHTGNVVDHIEIKNGFVHISWGIFEPMEHEYSFPIEWLYDDDWLSKHNAIVDENIKKNKERREENERKRKEFFS